MASRVLVSLKDCPDCEIAIKDNYQDIKNGALDLLEVEEDSEQYNNLLSAGINAFPVIVDRETLEQENMKRVCLIDPLDDTKQCVKIKNE